MSILNRGFTLLEALLYMAILAVVMYFVGGFAYNVYMGKDKLQAVQDINTNARLMLDTMTSNIEQSETINTPN